jgi:hypothetical protein
MNILHVDINFLDLDSHLDFLHEFLPVIHTVLILWLQSILSLTWTLL